ITGYYRRATTEARPMNRLVAAVMLATIAGVVVEIVRHCVPAWVAWASLVVGAVPITVAGARTVPSAVRLGARGDDVAKQSALAVSIAHRKAGVRGEHERAARTAARLGERPSGDSGGESPPQTLLEREFPPVVDLFAPVCGLIGVVAGAWAAGGPHPLAIVR